MTRRNFPVIFFGLLIVAIIAHSVAIGLIWLALLAGYGISLVIHSRARRVRRNSSDLRR